MCEHLNSRITIRHRVDRNYSVAGKQVGADVPLPDGTLSYACPDCGQQGSGNANGSGAELPRWVLKVVQQVRVVR